MRRQLAAQDNAGPQCIVASIDVLARKCAQALECALDLSQVLHQKRERLPTTSLYFFTPANVEAEIRGENRPVLPLPDPTRWLHVAIDFDFVEGKTWRLNHISIGLLHGDSSITSKSPVLRAEWQIHEKVEDSGHAQPHWHVLGAAGIGDAPLPTFDEFVEASPGFEEFLTGPRPSVVSDSGFGHFHYAMVTDWHCTPSKGPCQALDSEASLLSWLEGCVRYISHQLAHVDRKAGKATVSPT